jgi:hypothetical protein
MVQDRSACIKDGDSSAYATLLEPYATTETPGFSFLRSSSDFQRAIADLKSHAVSRAAAVASYLTR